MELRPRDRSWRRVSQYNGKDLNSLLHINLSNNEFSGTVGSFSSLPEDLRTLDIYIK